MLPFVRRCVMRAWCTPSQDEEVGSWSGASLAELYGEMLTMLHVYRTTGQVDLITVVDITDLLQPNTEFNS